MAVTYEDVKQSQEIRTYITQADASLLALGFTEHSYAHVGRCAAIAGDLLRDLGYDGHTIELCRIAAFMHDIGNVVNRNDHAQTGAVMPWPPPSFWPTRPTCAAAGCATRTSPASTSTTG